VGFYLPHISPPQLYKLSTGNATEEKAQLRENCGLMVKVLHPLMLGDI
jgi:hypothetical protein